MRTKTFFSQPKGHTRMIGYFLDPDHKKVGKNMKNWFLIFILDFLHFLACFSF